MKHICLAPSSSQRLDKSKIYPIQTHSSGIPVSPLAQITPATTVSDVTPQTFPIHTPIFIICTGQQLPKNINGGKTLIQSTNGQILNDAAVVQAATQVRQQQVLPSISGTGLQGPAQIILPSQTGITQGNSVTQTNGLVQHKFDIPNGHHPTLINSQTVLHQAAPTLINLNGTTALIQPSTHPTSIFSPQSLISGPVKSISYTTAPPQIMTSTTNSTSSLPALPPDPLKRRVLLKQDLPICISHNSISENKRTPPPLVQVKQEEKVAQNSTPRVIQAIPASPNTGHLQLSPKTTVFPYPLAPEMNRSLNTSSAQNIIVKTPNTHTSLPYILLDEKNRPSPSHIVVKPQGISSQQVYSGNSMPTYHFSALNTIQPIQILTPIPAHSSCIPPDFVKQDTTTAH